MPAFRLHSLLLLAIISLVGAIPGTTHDLTASASLRAINQAAGIPLPSSAQLKGSLQHQFTVFMHWSMCTYTGCQWNTAVSPPSNFTPPDMGPNVTQWFEAVKVLGATQVCLTVRHVGGFTLWNSATTNYSVAASPWRGGKGDIVADFTDAARAAGISPCLYIILGFDVQANHTGVPGPTYLDHQVVALTELLTNYGQIDRLWWDNYAISCCQPVTHDGLFCEGGSTTSTPNPTCPGWQLLIDTVRALSPDTAIVPGPDGCLVNGESFGGTYPLYHATSLSQNSYTCTDANRPNAGPFFAVVESDFTILEPGDNWFWAEKDPYLNASSMLEQFNAKLEQGANLILNIPPNSSGVVEEAYVVEMAKFGASRAATFGSPKASLPAPVSAPCSSLSLTLPVSGTFDTVLLSEDLVGGQVVGSYTLEVKDGATGAWRVLAEGVREGGVGVHGKTVGLRLLDSVGVQSGVSELRFNCSGDLAPPSPPPGTPPYTFVNSAGLCLGLAENATFPCYVGGPAPFSLCPLVATPCSGKGVVAWTPGGSGSGGLSAPGVSPDAVVNVDCNNCGVGTHTKLIKNTGCNCESALAYNEGAQRIEVGACTGMCLSNGVVGGANASCAGVEPWAPTQVHLVECSTGRVEDVTWSRVSLPPLPPIVTMAFVGAFMQHLPGEEVPQ